MLSGLATYHGVGSDSSQPARCLLLPAADAAAPLAQRGRGLLQRVSHAEKAGHSQRKPQAVHAHSLTSYLHQIWSETRAVQFETLQHWVGGVGGVGGEAALCASTEPSMLQCPRK